MSLVLAERPGTVPYRNDLPFKPYRYNGTGKDTLTPELDRDPAPQSHLGTKVHLDRDGRSRCGVGNARVTADLDGVTCQNCRSLNAGILNVGRRTAKEPCGTAAAYRRHYRKGEPIDQACRAAETTRTAQARAARQQRQEAA